MKFALSLMKNRYLILSIIGFILPNYFSIKESIEAQNILLWTKPLETFNAMFANNINSAFSTDLFYVVIIFFLWILTEHKSLSKGKKVLLILLTMFFGMAGTFPLFLYWKPKSTI